MKYTFYTYDEHTEEDIEHTWNVNYTIQPGEEESRRGHPDNWYEGSGPEMTSMDITDENGVDITATVSDQQRGEIEEKCWKDAMEYAGDY